MAGEASAQREKQDQSIKARKNELFVGEEVETGPRRKLRDYLRDTPAAPLSKNVKLMLWGSAAPVVFLFAAALLAGSKSSTAKAPEGMVIPVHAKPAPAPLARRSDDKPPAPAVDGAKPGEPKADAGANPEKPPQEKAKPKKKKKSSKKKAKPKDETAVVQNTEGDKGKDGEPKDKNDDPKKTSKSDSSTTGAKDKGAMSQDAKNKSMTPEKKRAAPIIKKKKPPVFTYPKRDGEKKADPDSVDDLL